MTQPQFEAGSVRVAGPDAFVSVTVALDDGTHEGQVHLVRSDDWRGWRTAGIGYRHPAEWVSPELLGPLARVPLSSVWHELEVTAIDAAMRYAQAHVSEIKL